MSVCVCRCSNTVDIGLDVACVWTVYLKSQKPPSVKALHARLMTLLSHSAIKTAFIPPSAIFYLITNKVI